MKNFVMDKKFATFLKGALYLLIFQLASIVSLALYWNFTVPLWKQNWIYETIFLIQSDEDGANEFPYVAYAYPQAWKRHISNTSPVEYLPNRDIAESKTGAPDVYGADLLKISSTR